MDVLTNFIVVHISQYIFTCIKSSHCRKCPGDGPHASIAGYLGSIPGLGRSPGEGNGCPLQHSGLENPMDREAW